jgi:hypothetical protein
MRTALLLCILASAIVLAVAQPGGVPQPPQQPHQPPQQPPTTPPPTGGSPDIAALHRSISGIEAAVQSLSSAHSSSATDLKAGGTQLGTNFQNLNTAVQDGLTHLRSAADARSKDHDDIRKRLTNLEKELAEIKGIVQGISAAQSKNTGGSASDATLNKVLANQEKILSQLQNVTSTWNFDHQAILEATKNSSLQFYNFVQKWGGELATQYPHVLAKGQELGQVGLEHAGVLGEHAQKLGADAHVHLSDFLQAKGVPQEHVAIASIAILALIGVLVLISLLAVVKAFFRIICCRGGKKKKQDQKNNPNSKKNQ